MRTLDFPVSLLCRCSCCNEDWKWNNGCNYFFAGELNRNQSSLIIALMLVWRRVRAIQASRLICLVLTHVWVNGTEPERKWSACQTRCYWRATQPFYNRTSHTSEHHAPLNPPSIGAGTGGRCVCAFKFWWECEQRATHTLSHTHTLIPTAVSSLSQIWKNKASADGY